MFDETAQSHRFGTHFGPDSPVALVDGVAAKRIA
jgi:hypothetical protein